MSAQYTIGLDYGTNSVRALIVKTADGQEVATAVWPYEHGNAGVILGRDPNLARQHPGDYIKGAEVTIRNALADAKKHVRGFKPEQIVGIGVDTTGSTPLPVDASGQPLAFQKRFHKNPAAMAWLYLCAALSRCVRSPPVFSSRISPWRFLWSTTRTGRPISTRFRRPTKEPPWCKWPGLGRP